MKSIYEQGFLEEQGFFNSDYGWSYDIKPPTKILRLISSNGYMYPQIEELAEFSNGEAQIVSLERINKQSELIELKSVLSKIL